MTQLGQAQSFTSYNNASIFSAVNSLVSFNADVVFLLGLYGDAQNLIQVMQQLNFHPKALYLTSAPGTPAFVASFGSAVSYVLGSVQWQQTISAQHFDSLFGTALNYYNLYYN